MSAAKKTPSLSLVIVAQNEERTIERVLAAAKPIVNEIVFVDSGSTDRTPEIAKSFGADFFEQPWLGYSAQKNFALSRATGDWSLSLDADEVLSQPLVEEIKTLMASQDLNRFTGYKIPRILYIADQPVMHGGFYPDAQLRLFRTGTGRFNQRLVHEAVRVEGPVTTLSSPMLHYAYADVGEFAAAMDKYARLSAQEFATRPKNRWRYHAVNQFLHPYWTL
ncbi:MAG: glycosyltransferase family 2 protein, partial [Terriglobales bacterium]